MVVELMAELVEVTAVPAWAVPEMAIASPRIVGVPEYISRYSWKQCKQSTIRRIRHTPGNPDHVVPVSLDQAKRLQDVVLVRIACHVCNRQAITLLGAAGRGDNRGLNTCISQVCCYGRQAVGRIDSNLRSVNGYGSGKA